MARRERIYTISERNVVNIFRQMSSPGKQITIPKFDGIPDDAIIHFCQWDFQTREFCFVIEHSDFDEVADGHPTPRFPGNVFSQTALIAFGAAEKIMSERWRQIMKGFDEKHDAVHSDGSIVTAASAVLSGVETGHVHGDIGSWPGDLALHVMEKYENDPVQRLTIAGALIAAEIDRLDRLSGKWGTAFTPPDGLVTNESVAVHEYQQADTENVVQK
jgi:hypothetical protein